MATISRCVQGVSFLSHLSAFSSSLFAPFPPFAHVVLSVLLLFFGTYACPVNAALLLPSDLRGESVSFLPYLDYVLDETGTLDIDTITMQGKNLKFMPLRPLDFDMKAGTFWLRFTIAQLPEGARSVEWLLSLGESIPGDPIFYVPEFQPVTGTQQWRAIQVTDRHIINLPEAGSESKTCYIRLGGPPGLWFAPMLRSPHNAANNWGALAHPASILGLFVIMLLCLLRCFSERGQWRIWTVLFVGGALASAYFGLPMLEKGHIGFDQFISALAPGVTLMLLPHVARHMMLSTVHSRIVDAQLILLTLIGAAVTLFPLVPGFSHVARFLELWPLGTLFFIPTALWALFIGMPASQRFLLICVFPPVFTIAGVLGLFSGLPADYLSSLPLCGVALSSLMLVAAPNPRLPEEAGEKKKEEKEARETKKKSEDLSLLPMEESEAETKKDSNLNLALPVPREVAKATSGSISLRSDTPFDSVPQILLLARQLEKIDIPLSLRSRIVALREQAERVSDALCGTKFIKGTLTEDKKATVDLQNLMRSMYACAIQESKDTGIALAWYMPPELPHMYTGNATRIHTVLMQLVESAVASTRSGSVHFTVRHYPNSPDPGHLLFTITDTGDLQESDKRSGGAIANAWDLAASCRGALTILSDSQGTTVSLALHLGVPDVASVQTNISIPFIVICSQQQKMRSRIKSILSDMRCHIQEAVSISEAQEIHVTTPAILFIIHDTLATPKASLLIRTIRKQARDAGLPLCRILAITRTDNNWDQLGQAGFTHALLEPLDEEALRQTVSDFLEIYNKNISINPIDHVKEQPIPDLFGKAAGNVPKDIDELIDIARVLNSFSTLDTISKQVEKEEERKQREHQVRRAIHPELLLESNKKSKPSTRKPEVAKNAAEQPKKPVAQTEPTEEELLTRYLNESEGLHMPLVDVQEQASQEKGGDAGAAGQRGTEGPFFSDDEWVGEPVPVQRKAPGKRGDTSDNKPREYVSSPAQNEPPFTEGDEWVGEPFPVGSKPKGTQKGEEIKKNVSSSQDPSPRSMNVSKEIKEVQTNRTLDQIMRKAQGKKSTTGRGEKVKEDDKPDPAMVEFTRRLDEAIEDARIALAASQSMRVAEAAGRIAAECDAFSFRVLARIARCVEDAGKAGDLNALRDLLPELEHQVERNNIALLNAR